MSNQTIASMPPTFWQTRQELQKYQLKTLRALLRHVWHRSGFYRELYSSHGIRESDIDSISVNDLPFVSKQALTDNFDSAVTDSRLKKKSLEEWIRDGHGPWEDFLGEFIVVHSSGTSGYRAFFPCDRPGYHVMTTIVAEHLAPPKRERKTKIAIYRGSHGNFGSAVSGVRLPKSVYEVLLLSLLEPTQSIVEQLNAFQPDRLDGHASSIALLARHARQGKLRIRPEQIIVSGDSLTGNMERTIKAAWDVPLSVLYTCSESFCLALRKPGEGNEMTVLDDLNILEVLGNDDQPVTPGNQGRIVITNLYNYTLPILRYELRDYGIRAGDRSDSPFTRIRHLIGRENENLPVVLDDGTEDALNPLILHEFCETGLQNEYRVSGIEEVQFISKRPGQVEIQYTSAGNIDAQVRDEFRRLLEKAGATRTQFDVVRIGNIPPNSETGKHQLVRIEKGHPIVIRTPVQAFPSLERSVAADKAFEAFPTGATQQSIPERFEQQVRKYSDRLAIKIAGQEMTYDDLNRAANRVAHTLHDLADAGPQAVALLCEQGTAVIAAIFGVLKAGKFFMPLDTTYPAPRMASMLNDAEAKIILTDGENLAQARALAGDSSLVIDLDQVPNNTSAMDPSLKIAPEAFAFIIYTSGSTGQPKGVIQNHRNSLHNAMTYTEDAHICPNDRIALLRQVSVLGAMRQIFGALLNGASLFSYDVRQEGTTHLANWLNAEKITDCFFSAPLFRDFLDTLSGQEDFPALRLVEIGSDSLRQHDVERYQKLFPRHCVLMNGLSCTEAGTVRRYIVRNDTKLSTATVPVGYPVTDMEVLLLDDNGQQVASGQVGEIVIRSRYLSPGYWQRSDLTVTAFAEDPDNSDKRLFRTGDLGRMWADGLLEHLGRKDSRVKIRGYNVEVFEIEQALRDLEIIKDAVVMPSEDHAGDLRLVAYIVPEGIPGPSASELRFLLTKNLPEYMVPSAFVILEAIPLNPNGKLDRRALPTPDKSRPRLENQAVAPRSPMEKALSEIWMEVLGLDSVGIHDHFFDLGGNSLQATQVITRVNRTYGITVPFRDFFEKPTIENLALLALLCLTAEMDTITLSRILDGRE